MMPAFLNLKARDMLLAIAGKEAPSGPLKSIEKSLVSKITPRRLFLVNVIEMNALFYGAACDANSHSVPCKIEKRKDCYNYSSCAFSFDSPLSYHDSIKLLKTEQFFYAQGGMHRKLGLSSEDQRACIYGGILDRRNFISPLIAMCDVAIGFVSGVILNFFYAAASAIVYAPGNVSIKAKVGVVDPEDAPNLNDYFIDGYRNQLRLLKVQNSILDLVSALAVGMVFNILFQ